MKTIKTYGIYGLLEWHGSVHCNGVAMKLDFTNGSTTAYGVAPATFTTKDKLTQSFIEHSDEFKSGRIKLTRKVVLDTLDGSATANNDKAKEYPDVTKTQEATDILQNEYHYNVKSIRSKEQAREAAKKVGISFPKLQ